MNNREIEAFGRRFALAEAAYLNAKEEYETAMEKHLAWVERERIIKLLENANCKTNDHDYNGGCNCDVIALIKGENK
jgi:hypothetical protein